MGPRGAALYLTHDTLKQRLDIILLVFHLSDFLQVNIGTASLNLKLSPRLNFGLSSISSVELFI